MEEQKRELGEYEGFDGFGATCRLEIERVGLGGRRAVQGGLRAGRCGLFMLEPGPLILWRRVVGLTLQLGIYIGLSVLGSALCSGEGEADGNCGAACITGTGTAMSMARGEPGIGFVLGGGASTLVGDEKGRDEAKSSSVARASLLGRARGPTYRGDYLWMALRVDH